MSSSANLLATAVALGSLAGCTDQAIVVDVSATAMTAVTVGPEDNEHAPEDEAGYRWELVSAPDASSTQLPEADALLTFVPDTRGIYLVERWLEYGLSERLTHRFVVNAAGTLPIASAGTDATVAAGTSVSLDGAASHSAEGLALVYRWRLVSRPLGSDAVLVGAEQPLAMLSTDAAGIYSVQLSVFDGELWGSPDSVSVTAR